MNDAELIREHIAALDAPTTVNGVDVEFGLDSTGDPAVWIYIHVPENDSWEYAAELARFGQAVTSAILDTDDGQLWPYVHFRSP